jgi:hypothetical protein
MKFEEATSAEEESMSITSFCPKCGNRTSLLTNPGETQLLRALNAWTGGQILMAELMEMARGTLAREREQVFVSQTPAAEPKEGVTWTKMAKEFVVDLHEQSQTGRTHD